MIHKYTWSIIVYKKNLISKVAYLKPTLKLPFLEVLGSRYNEKWLWWKSAKSTDLARHFFTWWFCSGSTECLLGSESSWKRIISIIWFIKTKINALWTSFLSMNYKEREKKSISKILTHLLKANVRKLTWKIIICFSITFLSGLYWDDEFWKKRENKI